MHVKYNLLVCEVWTTAVTGSADVITIPMTQFYTTNAGYSGCELYETNINGPN